MKIIVILAALALLSACGGRSPNPVASYQIGDDAMNCAEIRAEAYHIDTQIARLIPESKKTGKNVALGVTGWFLIVPWFFMDLSDAEKVEIKAYQDRYLALQKLASRRGCDGMLSDEEIEVVSELTGPEADPATRLRAIRRMLDEELITEEEFQALRAEILESI